jgi:hypothetical protein
MKFDVTHFEGLVEEAIDADFHHSTECINVEDKTEAILACHLTREALLNYVKECI